MTAPPQTSYCPFNRPAASFRNRRGPSSTMLYLLGIDPAKLAVKYQGLDVRLTGAQGGTVVRDIIA